jgi:hypothetical protein
MRLELFVLAVTGFFIYNAYHDGKYSSFLLDYKKYYKMAFYGVLGIGIYLMLRKNPEQGRNMLYYANNMVKFLPIDKTSMDLLSPIIDFTGHNQEQGQQFMAQFNGINPIQHYQDKRILGSGKATKRSVSETKKKYVASMQDWKCGDCGNKLNAWYEVDHKVRLEYGGSNDVQNLVALCRECHGKKTAMENM